MGSGIYSSVTADAVTSARIASGTTFGYHRTASMSANPTAHESLDVKRLNSAGQNIREARDSDEHPVSKPMVIAFDQTGSMGSVPRDMVTKLKSVFGLTVDKGVTDVQVAIAAYGDAANNEYVPLQFSQFESDNKTDDNLDNLFLEGNGGGNNGETSNLLWYYLAYHTATDSFDKRGIKGKVYMIADEKQLPITTAHIEKYIGESPQGPLGFEAIAAAATEKWDITVLFVDNSSAKWQRSEEFYKGLLGPDNVIVLQGTDNIPDIIAGLFAYDMGVDESDIIGGLSDSKTVALRVGNAIQQRKSSRTVALR